MHLRRLGPAFRRPRLASAAADARLPSPHFSLLLVLSRTPGLNQWLPVADFFRVALVVHVEAVIDRVPLQVGHETGDIDDGHEDPSRVQR